MFVGAAKFGAALAIAVAMTLVSARKAITNLHPVAVDAVDVQPRSYAYRMAGEFDRNGRPVDAPLVQVRRETALHVMRRQVTASEFERCVSDGICAARPEGERAEPDLPAVQVNWRDAASYAAWLSKQTGEDWRLPTDEEWAFFAGSRFHDDGLRVASTEDPSKRWLARYELASQRGAPDPHPRRVGAFGVNEFGLEDLSGNVWEWTSACFTRRSVDEADGKEHSLSENCGVRIAEGAHRAYVIDFIRDAREGGCSVGAPPANLGLRLVREEPKGSSIYFVWPRR